MSKDKQGMQKLQDGVKGFLKGEKRMKIIVAIGLIGMLLFLLSEYLPKSAKSSDAKTTTQAVMDTKSYEQELEERLGAVIASIDGAGPSKVMVTLENGLESVFVANEKNEHETGDNTDSSSQKTSEDKQYIVLKTSDGEEALVAKQIQPKIRGVIVVCQGGDNTYIKQAIISAVSAAFDVSSANISVIKGSPAAE